MLSFHESHIFMWESLLFQSIRFMTPFTTTYNIYITVLLSCAAHQQQDQDRQVRRSFSQQITSSLPSSQCGADPAILRTTIPFPDNKSPNLQTPLTVSGRSEAESRAQHADLSLSRGGFLTPIEYTLLYAMLAVSTVYPETEQDISEFLLVKIKTPPKAIAPPNSEKRKKRTRTRKCPCS